MDVIDWPVTDDDDDDDDAFYFLLKLPSMLDLTLPLYGRNGYS